jgi:hypothetical protein
VEAVTPEEKAAAEAAVLAEAARIVAPTRVVWVPKLADPTAPTSDEINAGVELGSELRFAEDETANTDPATLLPEHTDRYRVRRWRLDENHEITAVTRLPEDDDSAPS